MSLDFPLSVRSRIFFRSRRGGKGAAFLHCFFAPFPEKGILDYIAHRPIIQDLMYSTVRTLIEEKYARTLGLASEAGEGETLQTQPSAVTRQEEYPRRLTRRGDCNILAHYAFTGIRVFSVLHSYSIAFLDTRATNVIGTLGTACIGSGNFCVPPRFSSQAICPVRWAEPEAPFMVLGFDPQMGIILPFTYRRS